MCTNMQWPPGIGIAAVNLGLIGWTSAYGPIDTFATVSMVTSVSSRCKMTGAFAGCGTVALQQCNHAIMAPRLV